MIVRPKLEFDLNKIRENAVQVRETCDRYGITPTFAIKGFCAAYEIVKVMLDAGITRFCDSRIDNIINLKSEHPELYVMMVRTPAPAEAEEVVKWASASLQCETDTVKAISEAAEDAGLVHDIYLDIDVGDIRDGLFGDDQIDEFVEQIVGLPGINIVGVLANVGCVGSVLPDENNTAALAAVRDRLNARYGLNIRYASFGGTVAFSMINEGRMPEGINEFRFGEAALFGQDTTGNRMIPGFHKDAIMFYAPVVEKKRKPSVPVGTLGLDACGNTGIYIDRGIRSRVICAVGKQDVVPDALTPTDPGMIYIGASSDHIIMDVEEAGTEVNVGDYIRFRCGYMAMLSACTSRYVEKVYKS